jgi:hypothetical protein
MRTFLATLVLAAVVSAQGFDELFPDATVFYVSVENAGHTKERWEKSPLHALWKSEAMQAFLKKPSAKWAELMQEIRTKDEFTPEDVLDVLAGQAAVGVTWPAGAKEPELVLLADIGTNADKLKEIIAKAEKTGSDEGERRDEEDYRGVKIVHYSQKAESGEWEEHGAWFLDGTTFALAEKADLLKDTLARKGRADGTLATREAYRHARSRSGARASDFCFYFDMANLLQSMQQNGELAGNEAAMFELTGLADVEAIDIELGLEPGGVVTRAFLGAKGPKKGILKLFDGKNVALLPPRYVPADALLAGAMALDVPALWEEVRRIADAAQPGTTTKIDEALRQLKLQTGVDIVADVLGTLGSELSFHTAATEGPVTDPAAMVGRFTLSLQLKDHERFEGALDKLLAAVPFFQVATQDYLGVKLRRITTPFGPQPALAILPDRLVFSAVPDDLKETISRYGKETKGFLDREDVAKAVAKLPEQRIMITIEDAPKSMSASISAFGATAGALGEGDLSEYVDLSLFPPEEVLSKYLGIWTGCLVNEEDGLSYMNVLNLVGKDG